MRRLFNFFEGPCCGFLPESLSIHHAGVFVLLPLAALLWLCLYVTGALNLFPLFFRFVFTILIFSWLPGHVLFHLLNLGSSTWKVRYDSLSVILVSFSLSFSWTFLLNVLVFLLKLDLNQTIFLNCLLILCLSTFLWLYDSKRKCGRLAENTLNIPYRGIISFIGVLFLSFTLYRFLPFGFMVEELVVLRKIFESDAITMRGMAYMPNEATTYIFFPFYLLIAMVSRAVSVDVVIGVSMMWGFTCVIYMLSLVQISYFVSKSRYPGIIIYFATLIHALFYLHMRPDSNILTIFIPPSDRIGFSVCLLALAFFHFFIHMRDKKTNIGMFIGLIYLIIEIAFVHANEALLIVMCVFLFLLLLFLIRPLNILKIKRCALIIFICLSILFAYKYINFYINPGLHLYVDEMRELARTELNQKMGVCGTVKAFLFSPSAYTHEDGIGIWAYDASQFILAQLRYTPGTRFVFPMLLFLPLIIYLARNVYELFFPFLIICFMLIYMSDGVRLLLIMLVGSYHFFSAFMNVISIALIVIWSTTLYRFCKFLTEAFVSKERSYRSLLFVVLLPLSGSIYFSFKGTFHTLTGVFYVDLIIYMVSLFLLIWRCCRIPISYDMIKETVSTQPKRIFLNCLITAFMFLSVSETYLLNKSSKSRGIHEVLAYDFSPSSFGGDTVSDLHRLAKEANLNLTNIESIGLNLDTAALSFIRTKLPEKQIWWSTSSASILVYLNQYAPFVAEDGWLSRGWESNMNFLNSNFGIDIKDMSQEEKEKKLDLLQLLDVSRLTEVVLRHSLFSIFDRYNVRYILATELEYSHIIAALQENPTLQKRLRTIFDNGKTLIFEIIR